MAGGLLLTVGQRWLSWLLWASGGCHGYCGPVVAVLVTVGQRWLSWLLREMSGGDLLYAVPGKY